jgi:hypothetical protein
VGSAPRACIKLSNQIFSNVEAQNPESRKSRIEKISSGVPSRANFHIYIDQVKFVIKHHMWGVKKALGCTWLKRVFYKK